MPLIVSTLKMIARQSIDMGFAGIPGMAIFGHWNATKLCTFEWRSLFATLYICMRLNNGRLLTGNIPGV
jgi:hypothetical protein